MTASHCAAAGFAGVVAQRDVDELHAARHLVGGEALRDEGAQAGLVDPMALRGVDQGVRNLAKVVVRYPDDQAGQYRGVFGDRVSRSRRGRRCGRRR